MNIRVYQRIDINILAIIILGIVVFIAITRVDRGDKINKLFLKTSIIIIFELFFEIITCIINKQPYQWLIPIANIMHVCLFLTSPILTYSWARFLYTWVIPEYKCSIKHEYFLIIPMVVNSVITILSPFYGLVFYIDSHNIYHRGSIFLLSAFITYFYMAVAFVILFINRKKIVKYDYWPLIIFGVIPIVGGIVQSLFYGILLMWSSTAFSLVVIFIFLQQRIVQLDYLTSVWSRESFYSYVSQKIKTSGAPAFGVIFADLDELKKINDSFGHKEGDFIIRTAAEIIKSALSKTDVISRIGGDEFAVIIECNSLEDLNSTVERIKSCFDTYNDHSQKKYKIKCSFGADMYSDNNMSFEDFLDHVDELMYKNKKMTKL